MSVVMEINVWFISYVAILLLDTGFALGKHGEEKEPRVYNFWITLIVNLVQLFFIFKIIGY